MRAKWRSIIAGSASAEVKAADLLIADHECFKDNARASDMRHVKSLLARHSLLCPSRRVLHKHTITYGSFWGSLWISCEQIRASERTQQCQATGMAAEKV